MSARRFGQSLLEYAVLVAAVTSALVVMADYVRRAFNAHANAIEEELNGATVDNLPGTSPTPPPTTPPPTTPPRRPRPIPT